MWHLAAFAAATLPLLTAQCSSPGVTGSTAQDPPTAQEPLKPHAWKHRPVVIVAPSQTDPRLIEMRRRINERRPDFDERDMVLLVAADGSPRARSLRQRLGAGPASFGVYLVGKDTGTKLHVADTVVVERLFTLIDSMPMRQREIRERR